MRTAQKTAGIGTVFSSGINSANRHSTGGRQKGTVLEKEKESCDGLSTGSWEGKSPTGRKGIPKREEATKSPV